MKLDKSNIIKIMIHFLVLIIPILIEKFVYPNSPINIERLILTSSITEFITLNFTMNRKKLWDIIYSRRYIVVGTIFMYFVIMGYNGSSMMAYDSIIQPDIKAKDTVILGKQRDIRSDEYVVNTPFTISNVLFNNLEINNKYVMGGMGVKFDMYPHFPTKGFGAITSTGFISYLFLPIEQAFSICWYLPIFVTFMGLFELFMIITKKKKLLSLLGAVLITFSPSLLWWNAYSFLEHGLIAFHSFRLFLLTDIKKKKIMYTIIFALAGANYIMILYPPWQLCYGYLFLVLFIWQFVENKDRIKLKDIFYLLLAIIIIIGICTPLFLNSIEQLKAITGTIYPGSRYESGGSNWEYNFLYFPSMFYQFSDYINPCAYSQTYSLYPLPIIMMVYYLIKNRKNGFNNNRILSIMLLIIVGLFSIVNYFKVPLLTRITLLYMVPTSRIPVVVGVICVFLFIIVLSDYSKEKIEKKEIWLKVILSVLITFVIVSFVNKYTVLLDNNYYDLKKIIISVFIFGAFMSAFCINVKKFNNYLAIFMIVFSIITGILVFPINKGLSIYNDKPVAKVIKRISEWNDKQLWLVVQSDLRMSSYLLANGARVLNSANYYKNSDLWNIIDSTGENEYYYNRYIHMVVHLSDNRTSYLLLGTDFLDLTLDAKKVCELNVTNIYSSTDLLADNYKYLELIEVYKSDGSYIYSTRCN